MGVLSAHIQFLRTPDRQVGFMRLPAADPFWQVISSYCQGLPHWSEAPIHPAPGGKDQLQSRVPGFDALGAPQFST